MALVPVLPSAQSDSCAIEGTIASGRTPLPGVVVTVADASGRQIDATSSGVDGTFAIRLPAAGDYSLRAELAAFAPASRTVSLAAGACRQRIDLTLTLASRVRPAEAADAAAPRSAASTTQPPPATPSQAGGRGQRQGGGRGAAAAPFRSLQLVPDQNGVQDGAEDAGGQNAATQLLLPPGFSPETSAESVTAIGTGQQSNAFFGPNGPAQFAERFGAGFGGFDGGPGFAQGGPGGAGPGGPGGRFGGAGGGFGGPFGPGGFGGALGRGGRNQIRGSVFQSFDTSGLDAAPYALNGQATAKPDYLQQRFGATIGGPLTIPKVVDSPRTFFFLNYTGNHSRNPFDAYSTVPTAAERSGDFSSLTRTLVDPVTGRPFPDNRIPAARIDPAAAALLSLMPAPNQDGDRQNFHTVTTNSTQLDDVNVRIVRTFGAAPQRSGGRFGGGGGGRGGRGPGASGSSNLNINVHYRRSDGTNTNVFPTLGGSQQLSAWDVPVSYSFTRWGMFQSIRSQFNRQRSDGTNLYAFSQNVAGAAGLLGVSADPFDWGAPNLSFASITSLRDMAPSTRVDRTIGIGDTMTKTHGAHTVRFGGDYRSIHTDSRSDANARGSYVFTGAYSGSDFADFLLGLPQQASVQFGPGLEQFRSTSWDLFVQDDWRATSRLTVNAGLRYEYFSPVSEADNRLVTLDVAPGFTAAAPVVAGASGPFSGSFSNTIVNPFRAGFAPRAGVAWRPTDATVVRAGYGINYNSSVYQGIAQQLAGQPPFASADTAIGAPGTLLPLETALQSATPFATTNSYAVDPNYRLGFVQIWNVDLQRDLSRTVQLGIGYTGTKGANLDVLRAPNRGANGLLIPGVAPFIWESSGADSILHSLTLRLRKRLTDGFAAGATYTLSKSIDDASSIGGGGNGVVAQNDQDLAAERGLSSFDQRHRFSADFAYELPFGSNRRWAADGLAADLLGGWQVNGNVQLASGTPYTVRVLGAVSDVLRGTNGTLRANYNGEPIEVSDPTALRFFNVDAFSIPAPGTFGNAGRNTVIGPGVSSVNLGIMRNVTLGQTRSLSIQLLATNVFNTVQFATIDTVVNSPTFGQVTSARPMRRVQIVTRFRF